MNKKREAFVGKNPINASGSQSGFRRAFLIGPVVPGKHSLKFIHAALKGLKFRNEDLGAQADRVTACNDLLIAIDGGLAVCKKLGITPALAVGDWDSLKPSQHKLLSTVPHVTLEKSKDRSDLAYAVDEALRLHGALEIHIFGVTGGRPDHHQAMLLELKSASEKCRQLVAHGPEAEYHFLSSFRAQDRSARQKRNRWEKRLKPGQIVSVFGEAKGVHYEGLKYQVPDGILSAKRTGSLGLSNESSGGVCSIEWVQGQLLVILPRTA
ncbi:MAG: thiamine diphosphokinase [Methylotenera sp.]|nr:thiamine diphosphokinase [Oligoflexia bacterium]